MKRIAVVFFILTLNTAAFGQFRVDFGIEAQVNTNKVKKWEQVELYSESAITLSTLDLFGDTLDIYFNQFSMENNFEIPVYFRANWNRHFLDLKLSNSFNTLRMDGISNYNHSFFEGYYGSYADFESAAIANGFTDVDSSDYNVYISAARDDWESPTSYTEQFQLLSLTANYGYRFLPHKSVKPWISAGFTMKGKYRKVNYSYLDFSNNYVQDVRAIDDAIRDFGEFSMYLNFNAGLELYRFRLGAFFQTGFFFTFPYEEFDNSRVVYVNNYTPFDQLYSYGLNLSVDLFRHEFGFKVHKDDVTEKDLEVSKIKRKEDRWDIGLRFSRRGFNELSTFYGDSTNYLSVLTSDSVILADEQGNVFEGQVIESATFGDIKRIGWSGQFDIFGTRHFGKRHQMEMSLGYSGLNFDVETKELLATIATDSLGNNFYYQSLSTPRLRSGVYRMGFDLFHLNATYGFKFIKRDIFDLQFNVGAGLTIMAHRYQGFLDQPPGVNDLNLYTGVENGYYQDSTDNPMVYDEGPIDYDLYASPDEVTDKFSDDYRLDDRTTPKPMRFFYPTLRLGVTGNIDRFSLGLAAESSVGYMDGYMLENYSTIYFSIAYKVWKR